MYNETVADHMVPVNVVALVGAIYHPRQLLYDMPPRDALEDCFIDNIITSKVSPKTILSVPLC